MWEQIAAATDEIYARRPPANSFTLAQYQEKLKLTKDGAVKRIRRLIAAGRFEKLSARGPNGTAYYALCTPSTQTTRSRR